MQNCIAQSDLLGSKDPKHFTVKEHDMQADTRYKQVGNQSYPNQHVTTGCRPSASTLYTLATAGCCIHTGTKHTAQLGATYLLLFVLLFDL